MEPVRKNTSNLLCYGGVGSVTGANFMLDTGNMKLLVDCGLFQGSSLAHGENYKAFPYDPSTISYLLVTHAHIDHIGRIPKLVHDGFKGKILSTPETRAIAELMFRDAYKIMVSDAREKKTIPLYDPHDIDFALLLWVTVPYHKSYNLGHDIRMVYKDAGHILGSGMIELTRNDRKIVFTGDLGNSPSPLMCDTEPIVDAHYLIMDSVYGDRNHEGRKDRNEKLARILKQAISKGGTIIVPAFSLERTQVLLYEINNLVEEGVIPSVPVFLDSPLGIQLTSIYKKSTALFNEGVQKEITDGDDIFSFPKLSFSVTRDDSQGINSVHGSKLIIAGSGMSTGGRVLFHETKYLPDPKNTVLLVGYQSTGTIGRQLRDGHRSVNIKGVEVPVRATVEFIDGYSAHKDSDGLLAFVEQSAGTLEKVFVVMGEPKASLFLVQRLRDYFELDATYPEIGKKYQLQF